MNNSDGILYEWIKSAAAVAVESQVIAMAVTRSRIDRVQRKIFQENGAYYGDLERF